MGINNFFKIFKTYEETSIKNLKKDFDRNNNRKMIIAVDAMNELYRAALGMHKIAALTDTEGNPTLHINVILSNIMKMVKLDIEQIWIFDNKDGNIMKADENKRRADVKKQAREKIKKMIDDNFSEDSDADENNADKNNANNTEIDIHKLEKQAFSINSTMVEDIIFILECLGIQWLIASKDMEAEHVAACMTNKKMADFVMTADTDALVFGATKILKKMPKKTDKYQLYELNKILDEHKISRTDLAKIAVALGCDFDRKGIKNVGPKTVISKIKDGKVEFSKEQEKYIDKFLDDCGDFKVNKPNRTDESIDKLKKWLVNEKRFNQERIDKMLS